MENTETAVTGEKRFSSRDNNVEKPKFEALPTGDYELKFRGDKFTVASPSDANDDGLPYIKGQFEALCTNNPDKENSKNKVLFPMFFLKVTPTEKGFVAVKARGSVLDLAKAIREDLDVSVIEYTTKAGNTYEMLNPHEVVAWLRSKDGLVVKAHVKQEKGGEYKDSSGETKTRDDSNKIAYFIPS